MASERRLAFGGIAELYDRARPSYPAALIDDVLSFAGVGPGDGAVEVGAGTGKATVLFAERGVRILALEPSAEMALIARRNTAGFPEVDVCEVEFERWRPKERVRLLYSAQAWHWIQPESRFARAAEGLTEDGALAAFWNRVGWDASPVRDEFDAVYTRLVPELGRVAPGPMNPAYGRGEWMDDWRGGLAGNTGFTEPEWRTYSWRERYTTSEYLGLLQTHSDHIILEPARRQALLDGLGSVIERAGGILELEYVTRLALARPAPGSISRGREASNG
jgi:SAM-dependent methyltransferase